MPRHGHGHGQGFNPFAAPNGVPFWNFVESLANDLENQPIFTNVPGSRGHCRPSAQENGGISVSPRIRKWNVKFDPNGNTEKEDVSVSPLVDVYDTPESYIVIASVPGAISSEIEVDFDTTEHELAISGVISSSISEEHREKYLKIGERRVGKFERKVKIPAEPRVDDENIKAKYINGVLKVTLPKIQPVAPEKRRIAISVDDEEEGVQVEEEKPQEKSATASPVEEDSVIVESPAVDE